MTQQAVLLDQIIINNDLRQYHLSDFHSVIIIPLRENGSVSGTLKIYYRRTHSITSSLKEMAVGSPSSSPPRWRCRASSSSRR
jgi:two-component system LytT family sensor kinase